MDWSTEMTDREDEEVTFLLTLRPSPTPSRKVWTPVRGPSPGPRWEAPVVRIPQSSPRWEVALEPGRVPRTPTAPPPPPAQSPYAQCNAHQYKAENDWDLQYEPWKLEQLLNFEPQPPTRRHRPPIRPPRRPPRANVRRFPSWDAFPTKPYEVK